MMIKKLDAMYFIIYWKIFFLLPPILSQQSTQKRFLEEQLLPWKEIIYSVYYFFS